MRESTNMEQDVIAAEDAGTDPGILDEDSYLNSIFNVTSCLPDGSFEDYWDNGAIKKSGYVKNGLAEGEWTSHYYHGELKERCRFRLGKYHGEYRMFDEQGDTIMQGVYLDGMEQGVWVCFTSRQCIQISVYIDGKQTGHAEGYCNGRITYRNSWADGLQQGRELNFHYNGVLGLEGFHSKGQKHGEFRTFDENGELIRLEVYEYGEFLYKIDYGD